MENLFTAHIVTVAASNSTEEAKKVADFVCLGKNDELIIQKAINEADNKAKDVFLFEGTYSIDGFYDFNDNGPKSALVFPSNSHEIKLIGQKKCFIAGKNWENGVILYVDEKAFNGIDNESVDVIRSSWSDCGIFSGTCLTMKNIAVFVDNNTHPMRCIDFRRTWKVETENIFCHAFGKALRANSDEPAPIAQKGCIGITLTDGSNNAGNNFINMFSFYFDEGIQVGGEHPVLINCATVACTYGYTFGNYEFSCGANHPITLINCCDEQNINMPYFNKCGDKGGDISGGQEVNMISFNLERVESATPGGKVGNAMQEKVPGTWCGHIEFTLQPRWCDTNIVDAKAWEEDGSGIGFITRNSMHKTVASTKERLSYYPNYGQQIFDTDLQKMLICVSPKDKTWVDVNGNKVD